MLYKEGYVYHIKDEYFEKVNDDMLMQNKENGTYRPTFYCLKDAKTSLLWMVPLSSGPSMTNRQKNMAGASPLSLESLTGKAPLSSCRTCSLSLNAILTTYIPGTIIRSR
jgi:hypothetical protein